MEIPAINENNKNVSVAVVDHHHDHKNKSSVEVRDFDTKTISYKDIDSQSASAIQDYIDKHGDDSNSPQNRLDLASRRIQFRVDRQTGKMSIIVRDSQTKEIIQEIPSEEVRKISEKLQQYNGMIFDGKM